MTTSLRVATLLPSATETVCALGLGAQLVGVSHECDHPPHVRALPHLTTARLPHGASGADIDRDVRALVAQALSVYEVDVDALARARPDVIVTQDLCEVCAVSYGDVCRAVDTLGLRGTRIVNLHPLRLEDVLQDIVRVGGALEIEADATSFVRGLRDRIEIIRARAARLAHRPRVLTIEWLDPVMAGGTWMPELIELANGVPLAARAADHAPTLTESDLARLEPDVVLIKPCGFTLEQTRREHASIERALAALGGTARERGAVYLCDGNAFFNRPGPRIVESLAILAACVHPAEFTELAARHSGDFERWNPGPAGG